MDVLRTYVQNHWMKKASDWEFAFAKTVESTLELRKSPVQACFAVSLEAILKATIQVLLKVDKENLRTTRTTARAGVSAGTLYQYFLNKGALLRAALHRHMDETASVLQTVCREQTGSFLEKMATALVTSVLEVKMKNTKICAPHLQIYPPERARGPRTQRLFGLGRRRSF